MKQTRNRSRAIALAARPDDRRGGFSREAILALLAGSALVAAAMAVAPKAEGQVFSSQPYVAAPDPAVEQLRGRIDSLEGELKRSTDRSERLAFELSQVRKQAEEANAGRKQAEETVADLQRRMRALENLAGIEPQPAAGVSPSPTSAPAESEATINLLPAVTGGAQQAGLPEDEEGLLKESKNLLLGGNYKGAEEGYRAFLAKFGKSKNAHEAQYNLGESLLYQESYQEAANAYGKLLSAYPNSPNGPSALVKLARSLRLLKKPADACKTLALMDKQFPKASASAKQLAEAERQKANCK
ncbi:MAG TPA: tetratricopeptide repeat protein [Hyphomonadaceae bacterium]|nr:tetratricopeptide repeat protein [Hyphomonadaceae bacterium]